MSGRHLYLCGISHEKASSEQLGKCSVAKELCAQKESEILEKYGAREVLLLSTCNRVEYYIESQSPIDMREFATGQFGDLSDICQIESGAGVVEHIFEVAAGLRSQMTGETEIFGQVKAAYSRAFESGHCKAVLNAIFQKAAHVGKIIRSTTDIGHGKISIGGVSAELAAQIFDDISKAKILLIGSGEAGHLIADALFVRGARDITIVSRTRAHAEALAAQIGVGSSDLDAEMQRLGLYDIIICASSAGLIIGKDAVAAAAGMRTSPLFLIDLSVPKNVDESCSDIDDVFLYDMSNLSDIANANMHRRKAEIQKARLEISKRALSLSQKLGLIG